MRKNPGLLGPLTAAVDAEEEADGVCVFAEGVAVEVAIVADEATDGVVAAAEGATTVVEELIDGSAVAGVKGTTIGVEEATDGATAVGIARCGSRSLTMGTSTLL